MRNEMSKKPAERISDPESDPENRSSPSARGDKTSPTYQDVLDESLGETFPASDPISPGTAARREQPISTPKNPKDWARNTATDSNVFIKPLQELQQAQQPQASHANPNDAASPLPPERVRQLRAQLEHRARELVDELRAVEDDRPDTPTLTQTTVEDMAEHGEQRSRDAVRGAEQERDAGELRDIAAALARIDEGRYGICIECGNQIPFARLNVQSSALRCIQCQQQYERTHPAEVKAVLMR